MKKYLSIVIILSLFIGVKASALAVPSSDYIRVPVIVVPQQKTDLEKAVETRKKQQAEADQALKDAEEQAWRMGQVIENTQLKQQLDELRTEIKSSSEYQYNMWKADMTLYCMDNFGRSHFNETTNDCECDDNALFFGYTQKCEMPAVACIIKNGKDSVFTPDGQGGGQCSTPVQIPIETTQTAEVKTVFVPKTEDSGGYIPYDERPGATNIEEIDEAQITPVAKLPQIPLLRNEKPSIVYRILSFFTNIFR